MKKLSLFVVTSVLCTALLAVNGFAEDTGGGDPADLSTSISIEFIADEDPKPPVKPEKPDEEDKDEPGTGMTGNLTIDLVPSLTFGAEQNEIKSKLEEFCANEGRPNIQITDARGTGAGWTVMAELSRFQHADESPDKYFEGKITFKDSDVFAINSNGSTPPVLSNQSFILISGESTDLFGAVLGTGMGRWGVRWFSDNDGTDNPNKSVFLTVNTSNVYVGTYTGTITWIMSNTP